MATITSLKFDISSKWDGAAVRQAQGDLKMLNQDLRRLNNSRIRVGIDIDDTAFNERMRRLDNDMRNRMLQIQLDVDTARAEAQIDRMARDRRVVIDIDVDRNILGQLTQGFNNVGSSATSAGHAVQHSGRMMKIAMAVFAASLVALPGLINVVGGAMLAVLPAAFIAIAAVAQRENQTIVDSFTHLKNDVVNETKSMTSVLVDELANALDIVHDAFWRIRPALQQAFEAAQPLVAPLTQALTGLVENSMPGVVTAMQRMEPVAIHLRDAFGMFGTSMSNMFALMSEEANGLGMALEVTFVHIGVLMERFGLAARDMANTGTFVWGELLAGFNGLVDGILDGLTGFMAAASGPLGILVHMFGDQLGGAFREILPALGNVVGSLSEALTPILERLAPVVAQLAAAFLNSLVPVIEKLTPIAVALADGLATILEWITPMMPVLGPLAAAWWVLNAAMAANPMVLLVTAAAALAAGIVYLATRTQFFQNIWNAVWGFVKSVAENVWGWITSTWNATINGIVSAWQAVSTFFTNLWNTVWGGITGAAQAVWQGLQDKWNAFTSHISGAWNSLWNGVKSLFDMVMGAVSTAWNTVTNAFVTTWNTVGGMLKAAWEFIWDALRVFVVTGLTVIQVTFTNVINTLLNVWNTIGGALKAAWEFIWSAVRDFVLALWQGIQDRWNQLWQIVSDRWNAFSSWFSGVWNVAWSAVRDFVAGIWQWITDRWNAFWQAVSDRWNAFSTWFNGVWNTAWSWVRDFVSGIWQAITDRWNAFWQAVTDRWNAFWAWLQNIWNTAWSWVRDYVMAVWQAIQDRWNSFLETVKGVLQGAVDWVRNIWNETWSWVRDFAQGIWDTITGKINEFKTKIIETVQSIVDRVKAIWETIKGYFEGPVNQIKDIWNGFANIVGLRNGGQAEAESHATGGPVFGAGTATSDSIPAYLSRGEHVWTAAEVNAAGGQRAVYKMRKAVLERRGNPAQDQKGPIHTYAEGGALEYAKGIARDKGDGRAYVYGGSGPDGFDCSGYMSAIYNALTGRPLWNRSFSTESNFDGLGFRPGLTSRFAVGIMRGGGGPNSHMAGTLDGVNVESGGSHSSTRYGGPAVGADNGQFPIKYSLPEVGGGNFVSGGAGGGAGGPSPEQIAAANRAKEDIARIVNAKNVETASKRWAMTIHEMNRAANPGFIGPVSATELLPNAKNKFGWYAPAGDVHGSGTHRAGTHAISTIDQALSQMTAAIGGTIPEGERLAIIEAAMRATNTPPPSTHDAWVRGMNTLITRESNWNSGAVNNWDSNARAGNASRGLAQVIPTTFEAHKAPGLNNIDAPVDNVAASINYIKSRYGTIENVQQANANMPPKGYAGGTASARKGWNIVGENGPELVRFSGGEQVKSFDEIVSAVKDSAIGNTSRIIDNFTTEINSAIDRIGGQHTDALEQVVTSLSGEIKAFVAQAIQGQQASGEELAARISNELNNFLVGALAQAGVNMNMEVKLPNGATGTPQDFANAVRSQVFPELERFILQQVGKHK